MAESPAVVYKVELFLTPDQWDELSAWSLGRNAWVMLKHEGDQTGEYKREKLRMDESTAEMNAYYEAHGQEAGDKRYVCYVCHTTE